MLQSPEIGGAEVYADSAYRSKAQEESLVASKHTSHIHEKGTCNHPLTEMQKASNKKKLRVRARVEHVFGSMTNELGGITIRTIGHERAKVQIGLLYRIGMLPEDLTMSLMCCATMLDDINPQQEKIIKNRLTELNQPL